MLAGNRPIVVEKTNGSITKLGTARPFEDYIREYEKRSRQPGRAPWTPQEAVEPKLEPEVEPEIDLPIEPIP
ncbi:MAG TPA: hypothetical protein VF088_01440 [Pyrinomonadaceae bacterium]